MKIGIGTANFGQRYGINRINIKSSQEIHNILNLATHSGIKILDSSPNYGNSEKLLGEKKLDSFKIVTKIKLLPHETKLKKIIFTKIKKSLKKLKIKKFYAVMVHRSSDLNAARKEEFFKILRELKGENLVTKTGISIYDPKELDKIWSSWKPDIVQCPLNIFDQRIYNSGWLTKLKKYNIEVHARSIFLQGLLLMDYKNIPKKFHNWNNILKKWSDVCKKNNISKIDACLNFIKSFKNISHAIVGFKNASELKRIILSFKSVRKKLNIALPFNDVDLIDPRLW